MNFIGPRTPGARPTGPSPSRPCPSCPQMKKECKKEIQRQNTWMRMLSVKRYNDNIQSSLSRLILFCTRLVSSLACQASYSHHVRDLCNIKHAFMKPSQIFKIIQLLFVILIIVIVSGNKSRSTLQSTNGKPLIEFNS